jgi:Family of unknown function (DUF6455)
MASANKRDHKPACIYEMMKRLGIEAGGGILPRFSLTYSSALHRCEQCPTPEACREWLKTAPEAVNFTPKFCPNGDILFELQYDQLGRPHALEVKKRFNQA